MIKEKETFFSFFKDGTNLQILSNLFKKEHKLCRHKASFNAN